MSDFEVKGEPGGFAAEVRPLRDMPQPPAILTAPQLLRKAEEHMNDLVATYDRPEGERSMAKTVEIFNTYHGTQLKESQGWHLLQILKEVRELSRAAYHADSAEDEIAYAALKAEAKQKEGAK